MRVFIKVAASLEEAREVESYQHVPSTKKRGLVEKMLGNAAYEPRTGGQGQMLTCNRDSCNNHSMADARKQLCPAHYPKFLERSNRDSAKPKCRDCNIRTANLVLGEPMCRTCISKREKEEVDHQDRMREATKKELAFKSADTVEQLKDWIQEYIL